MRSLLLMLALAGFAGAKEDVSAAREHYRNGTKLFDLGKYLEAAKEYEAAYQGKDDPSLLFNIGQAYRLGGEKEAALRAYKSFLRRSPDSSNRVAVEARISELQKAIDAEQKAKEGPPEGTVRPMTIPKEEPTPATTAQPPPEKTPVYKKWWLWTTVAIVVVAGVSVGVGLGVGLQPKNFGPTVKDIGPSALTVQW
jgi:tetratricopeptide (TPR) repeat protein